MAEINPFKKFEDSDSKAYESQNDGVGIFIKKKFPDKYNVPGDWSILINIDVDKEKRLAVHLRAGVEDPDDTGKYIISDPVPNFRLQPIGYFISVDDGWKYNSQKNFFYKSNKEFSYQEFVDLLIHNFLHNELNDFFPRLKSYLKLSLYRFMFWLADSEYKIFDFWNKEVKVVHPKDKDPFMKYFNIHRNLLIIILSVILVSLILLINFTRLSFELFNLSNLLIAISIFILLAILQKVSLSLNKILSNESWQHKHAQKMWSKPFVFKTSKHRSFRLTKNQKNPTREGSL